MALQKPTIGTIAAFDATAAHTISFSVVGGDQVTANRILIKSGSSGDTVYDDTTTTFVLAHTIPANTLTNGNYYTVQIQTLNASSETSPISSPVAFYCYTTPSFSFSNLPTGNILSNSSYTFNLSYNQAEGEALSSYIVNVYGSAQNIIWTSGVVYVGSNGAPPSTFNINVSGFSDSHSYSIRATGQTMQLTEIDTGLISLTTNFNARNIYTQLGIENNVCDGYITITSNVISLDGISNPDPPTYIGGEEVDLSESGSYVTWENSFGIYESYTSRLWLRDPNPNSILATIYSTNSPNVGLTLYEREYTSSGTTYIYVECYYRDERGNVGYIYSTPITKPAAGTQMMIWLQKYLGLYDISIAEVSS